MLSPNKERIGRRRRRASTKAVTIAVAMAVAIAICAVPAGAAPAHAATGAFGSAGQAPPDQGVDVRSRGLLQPPTITPAPTPTPDPTDPAPTPPPTETPFPTSTPRPTDTPPPTATPPPATFTSTATPTTEPTAISSTRSSEDRPILILDSVRVEPSRPAPGDAFDLDIDVQNVGGEPARNVRLSLASEVFLPEGRSSAVWRDGIKPGEERDFETRMRVGSATTSGTYPIAVTLTWEDADGLQDTLQTSIAVEVAGAVSVRPLIAVLDVRLPGRVAPGIPFGVTFDLQNTGGREARNVVLVPTAGPLALHGGGQAAPVTIGPGGTASVALRAVGATVGEAGATSQTFEIRYDDPDGVRYTDTRLVGLSITTDAAYGPMPMIESYSVGGSLHPGQVFDLELEVRNVGASDALRTFLSLGGGTAPGDVSVTGSSLGVFAPLERSNRIFLDRLPAGKSTSISQKMVVDGAAKPGVYVLEVALSYDDADGQSRTGTEVVTLLVTRRVDLEISALEVITDTVVGQPVPFAVELINAGTATVNVGTVRVVGGRYMDVLADPRFIGPLDASAADVIEAQLTPRGAGEAVVTVEVDYLDDFNQQQTFEQEFVFQVAAEAAPDVSIDEDEQPPVRSRSLIVRVLRGLFGFGASDPAAPPAAVPGLERPDGAEGIERQDDSEGTLGEPAMEMEAPVEEEIEAPEDSGD